MRESCGYFQVLAALMRPCAWPSTATGSGSLLCLSLLLSVAAYRIVE